MKIIHTIPKPITSETGYEMHITDMTSAQWDQIRILLQTILKYGRFDNSEKILEGLTLESIIKAAG